jgi:hypothetical protein
MAEVTLTLFSGPHCGLCDDALDVVSPLVGDVYRLQIVDVTSSLELKKRYGLKIPVLYRDDTGEELDWPFDQAQVEAFLS